MVEINFLLWRYYNVIKKDGFIKKNDFCGDVHSMYV